MADRDVDAVLREQGLIEIPEPVLRSAALGLCDLRAWLICRRSGGHAPDGKVGAAHVVSQCARCGILVAVTPAD